MAIFTHYLSGHYNSNTLFLDISLVADKKQDLLSSVGSVQSQIKKMASQLSGVQKSYQTNEVLFLFGDDFSHEEAESSFAYMDIFIEKFRSMSQLKELGVPIEVNIEYSSVERYLNAPRALS